MPKTKLILSIIAFCCSVSVQAQKPFEELGLDNEVEVLTLSNGRYVEHFKNDTLRQIGSVMFNIVTNKIEYFIPEEDVERIRIAGREMEQSRFMSLDPMMKDFAHNSPYAFSENNVIHAIELEGLEREVIINRQVPTTAALSAGTGNTTFAPSGLQWFDLIMTQSVDGSGAQQDLAMRNNRATPINVSGRPVVSGRRTSAPTDVLTVNKNINDANTGFTNRAFETPWQARAIALASGSNPVTTPTTLNVTGVAGTVDLQSRNLPGSEILQNTFARHGHFRTLDATGGARNLATANPANQVNRYILDINALNQGGNLSNVTIDLRFQDAAPNAYTNGVVAAFTAAGYTVPPPAFGDATQPATDYFQVDIYLTPANQNNTTGNSNAGNSRQ